MCFVLFSLFECLFADVCVNVRSFVCVCCVCGLFCLFCLVCLFAVVCAVCGSLWIAVVCFVVLFHSFLFNFGSIFCVSLLCA